MVRAIGLVAYLLLPLLVWLSVAGAQTRTEEVWIEGADAPGAPTRVAQRTLWRGPLRAIVGTIDTSIGDTGDAFCVRIPDLARFVATTDPDLASRAGAEFGTTLRLLDSAGRPLLVGEAPSGDRHTLAPAGRSEASAAGGPSARASEYTLVVAGSGGSYSIALVGAEGCGTLDLVLAVGDLKMDRYCLGQADTPGDFHCHGVTGDMIETSAVALGDFDGDDDLDAAFGTTDVNEPNRLCPGDSIGRFSFEECVAIGGPGASGRGVATGDLDDDGALDAVFANAGAEPMVCLGDGALGFTCQPAEAISAQGRDVAMGHLDDDGHLDAVFANVGGASRACLGDGDGGFLSCGDVKPGGFDRGVALGHFDGDGNLDAAFVTSQAPDICLGDGTGSFTCSILQGAGGQGMGVTADLLDPDPHLDLVFTQFFDAYACLGDGSGAFTCSQFGAGHSFGQPTGVALADFDNDGLLDAAVSAKVGDSSICFGDGAGSFTGCRAINENRYRAEGVAVGVLAPASVGHDDFETGDLRAWATFFPDG